MCTHTSRDTGQIQCNTRAPFSQKFSTLTRRRKENLLRVRKMHGLGLSGAICDKSRHFRSLPTSLTEPTTEGRATTSEGSKTSFLP